MICILQIVLIQKLREEGLSQARMHISLAWIERAGLLVPGQRAVHQIPNSFMSRSIRLPLAVTSPSSLTADWMRTRRLVKMFLPVHPP